MVVMGVGASHPWPKQGLSPLKAIRTPYPILTYLIQYDTIQYYPILNHTKLYDTIWHLIPNFTVTVLPQQSHSDHRVVRTEWPANNPTEGFARPAQTCCT